MLCTACYIYWPVHFNWIFHDPWVINQCWRHQMCQHYQNNTSTLVFRIVFESALAFSLFYLFDWKFNYLMIICKTKCARQKCQTRLRGFAHPSASNQHRGRNLFWLVKSISYKWSNLFYRLLTSKLRWRDFILKIIQAKKNVLIRFYYRFIEKLSICPTPI